MVISARKCIIIILFEIEYVATYLVFNFRFLDDNILLTSWISVEKQSSFYATVPVSRSIFEIFEILKKKKLYVTNNNNR